MLRCRRYQIATIQQAKMVYRLRIAVDRGGKITMSSAFEILLLQVCKFLEVNDDHLKQEEVDK